MNIESILNLGLNTYGFENFIQKSIDDITNEIEELESQRILSDQNERRILKSILLNIHENISGIEQYS